ncbi:MAG: Holliday junction resolvase RuvX [Clostridia bacterium]|nr:Holliday junction resolvase RuvX [Clostridia bacterium]
MKFICYDIGNKRVGVAVSDPFMTMALPKETYWRKNFEKDVAFLAELAKKEGADRIVCGLPVKLDGTSSEQTELTMSFIEKLKSVTDIPVVTADERFSTKEATRVLIAGDVGRDKRKNYVDSIAASYILEDYINKLKNTVGLKQ